MIDDVPVTDPFTCSETGAAGSMSILIEGAIVSETAISNLTIVISNILNPSPALTTGGFQIEIGNDISNDAITITL